MASASVTSRIPKVTPDTSYGTAPSAPVEPSKALTPNVKLSKSDQIRRSRTDELI
jgi:hypothetical protein